MVVELLLLLSPGAAVVSGDWLAVVAAVVVAVADHDVLGW